MKLIHSGSHFRKAGVLKQEMQRKSMMRRLFLEMSEDFLLKKTKRI